MTASVIVVNYRTAHLSRLAVESALVEDADEVIVVDNDSGDGSVEALRSIANPRVRVLASPRNGGFGYGANLGARGATGDVLVFLNSDAHFQRGSLATLGARVAATDGRSIVGPRLVGADGAIQRSAGLVPRPDDLIVRGLGLHRVARALSSIPGVSGLISGTRIGREYDTSLTASEPREVTMISGACLAIGREAFHELGGFDERYFMYFEDADLCRRAAREGWPITYLPRAVVGHVGGASSPGDYRFGPSHAASMIRYLIDWHGRRGATVGLAILWLRAFGHTLLIRPGAGRARHALIAGLAVAAKRAR